MRPKSGGAEPHLPNRDRTEPCDGAIVCHIHATQARHQPTFSPWHSSFQTAVWEPLSIEGATSFVLSPPNQSETRAQGVLQSLVQVFVTREESLTCLHEAFCAVQLQAPQAASYATSRGYHSTTWKWGGEKERTDVRGIHGQRHTWKHARVTMKNRNPYSRDCD